MAIHSQQTIRLMIITREILEQHGACRHEIDRFTHDFPDGCPTPRSSKQQIRMLLEYEVIRENWGWAVLCGIIPAWAMCGANLSGVDLSGADLHWANFRLADLGGVNLTGANLRWADLYRADLSEAILEGAVLHGARLDRADLRAAKLPDGFDAEAAGAIT